MFHPPLSDTIASTVEKSRFKTILASVRPARVIILVDMADADWQHTCLRIIEFYSQLWGGAYNIIVPTNGATIDERFWSLMEAFDPDYIYRYWKSGEDIRLSDPNQYNHLLDKQVESSLEGREQRADVRSRIDKNLRSCWLPNFEITPGLHEEIKKRLSPFWLGQWVVDAGAITAGSTPPFHLTNIVNIISSTEHPDRIASIEAPPELLPALWFSAVTGRLSSAAIEAFEAAGLTRESFAFSSDNVGELIEFTIKGSARSARASHPDSTVPFDLTGVTPFSLSMLQLGLYRSVKYISAYEPMIAVAGNSLEDFCLYYCLSRLRDRVVWVLPSITEKAIALAKEAALSGVELSFLYDLRSAATSTQFDGGIGCISYSLASSQVNDVIA